MWSGSSQVGECLCVCMRVRPHPHSHADLPNPAGLLWERSLLGNKPCGPSTADLPVPGRSGQRFRAVGWVVTAPTGRTGPSPPTPITLPKDGGFQKHVRQVWSSRKTRADCVGRRRGWGVLPGPLLAFPSHPHASLGLVPLMPRSSRVWVWEKYKHLGTRRAWICGFLL